MANWQEVRSTWNQANLIRTWSAVLACALYLAVGYAGNGEQTPVN